MLHTRANVLLKSTVGGHRRLLVVLGTLVLVLENLAVNRTEGTLLGFVTYPQFGKRW